MIGMTSIITTQTKRNSVLDCVDWEIRGKKAQTPMKRPVDNERVIFDGTGPS